MIFALIRCILNRLLCFLLLFEIQIIDYFLCLRSNRSRRITAISRMYTFKGRRVQKQVFISGGPVAQVESTTHYIYNGWNLIKEIVIDEDGEKTVKSYVWGLDLSDSLEGAGGVGGLLASVDHTDNTQHFFSYDGNGNVGQLVDATTGYIAAHYEYDPYGNEILAAGEEAEENTFRFSTKYYDTDSRFYYYGYRYYLPEMGRWLTRDPIGEEGGLNLYAFVGNDSINAFDYLGLTCCWSVSDSDRAKNQQKIRNYAQRLSAGVGNGAITSCAGLADVWGYAAPYYECLLRDDVKAYVKDVSYVLSGVNVWGTGTDGSQVRGFNDSGFKLRFQDGSNQVQHFSAGVQTGFRYGAIAVVGHRLLRPDTPQDTALNDMSTGLGMLLSDAIIAPCDVKAWIERAICR